MFEPFPKISRLSKKAIVTEKIDGTNAQIFIGNGFDEHENQEQGGELLYAWNDKLDCRLVLFAGSRNRWLRTSARDDNFGFAKWVKDNAEELIKLGPGRHFGEWWGKGIGPRG